MHPHPQGADQGSPEELPQVRVNERVGMVHHYPKDQASYWKVGQHPSNFFTLSLRPDPNEELRLLEEKAAATYGVYKEKCDTKVSLLPSYWNYY